MRWTGRVAKGKRQKAIYGNGTTSMQGVLTALPTPFFTTAATAYHSGLADADISEPIGRAAGLAIRAPTVVTPGIPRTPSIRG
jgi:hypothetical protein